MPKAPIFTGECPSCHKSMKMLSDASASPNEVDWGCEGCNIVVTEKSEAVTGRFLSLEPHHLSYRGYMARQNGRPMEEWELASEIS